MMNMLGRLHFWEMKERRRKLLEKRRMGLTIIKSFSFKDDSITIVEKRRFVNNCSSIIIMILYTKED